MPTDMRMFAAALLVGMVARAQPASEFDVVSVKPLENASGTRVSPRMRCQNGEFTATAEWIGTILMWAYNMREYQLFGLPKWTHGPMADFDIAAKGSPDTTVEQCREMVQKVLADRFKLAGHRETRSFKAYAVTVAQGGAKMKPAAPNGEAPGLRIRIDDKDFFPPGQKLLGWNMASLITLVQLNTGETQTPFLDRTGLDGRYEFSLEMGSTARGHVPPDGLPEPFTALREQLGLDVKTVTARLDVLVVERLERPDAN